MLLWSGLVIFFQIKMSIYNCTLDSRTCLLRCFNIDIVTRFVNLWVFCSGYIVEERCYAREALTVWSLGSESGMVELWLKWNKREVDLDAVTLG